MHPEHKKILDEQKNRHVSHHSRLYWLKIIIYVACFAFIAAMIWLLINAVNNLSLKQQLIQQQEQNINIRPSIYRQDAIPTDTAKITPIQTKDFPVYPGAKLVSSHKDDCDTKTDQPDFCFKNSSTWETTDPGSVVREWYQKDKANSGWKCETGGGFGGIIDENNFTIQSDCKFNNNKNIWARYQIHADGKKTTFSIATDPVDTNSL